MNGYIIFIMITTVGAYFIGKLVQEAQEEKRAEKKRERQYLIVDASDYVEKRWLGSWHQADKQTIRGYINHLELRIDNLESKIK